MVFLLISFMAGVLTVFAPCVFALLPVIVGGTITGDQNRKRAIVVTLSLALSILLFTFLLKVSTVFIMVPPTFWQYVSGAILILFGLLMVFPRIWDSFGFVSAVNRESNKLLAVGYQQNSFWGDVLMGAALGPVFSSCSPTYFVILASVLPASFFMGFLDLLAYCAGLSIMLLLIALVGQRLVDRLGIVADSSGWLRRSIGILFLIIGIAVATGAMAKFEAYLIEHFDVTALEQRLLRSQEKEDSLSCKDGRCTMQGATSTLSIEAKNSFYQKAPELTGISHYVNTGGKEIKLADYRGKNVVLVDIWTFSCINCQRTLPYIKMWYEKYHDQGLEIIGVHTPEFAFEKLPMNVENSVRQFGVKYPVVLDNEYKTWNAFNNQYWPRKYLIDIDGYIVYDHAGEGGYDEAEKAIQKALAERAARLGENTMALSQSGEPKDAIDVDFTKVRSPETYFGALRNENIGNGAPGLTGEKSFIIPENTFSNLLYLGGRWKIEEEFAQNQKDGDRILFKYDSKNVYFVASAHPPGGGPVRVRVLLDGKVVGHERGADVAADGYVTIQENRLYKVIESDTYGPHTLELLIEGTGIEAYTFTFG